MDALLTDVQIMKIPRPKFLSSPKGGVTSRSSPLPHFSSLSPVMASSDHHQLIPSSWVKTTAKINDILPKPDGIIPNSSRGFRPPPSSVPNSPSTPDQVPPQPCKREIYPEEPPKDYFDEDLDIEALKISGERKGVVNGAGIDSEEPLERGPQNTKNGPQSTRNGPHIAKRPLQATS